MAAGIYSFECVWWRSVVQFTKAGGLDLLCSVWAVLRCLCFVLVNDWPACLLLSRCILQSDRAVDLMSEGFCCAAAVVPGCPVMGPKSWETWYRLDTEHWGQGLVPQRGMGVIGKQHISGLGCCIWGLLTWVSGWVDGHLQNIHHYYFIVTLCRSYQLILVISMFNVFIKTPRAALNWFPLEFLHVVLGKIRRSAL